MQNCQVWLPQTALFDNRLNDEVARQTQAWARRWLVSEKLPVLRTITGGGRRSEKVKSWQSTCGGIRIFADTSTITRVAAGMLGLRLVPRRPGPRDLKLFREMTSAGIGDLIKVLSNVFPTNPGMATGPIDEYRDDHVECAICFCLSLGPTGGDLRIAISAHAANSGRKALAAAGRSPKSLGKKSDAIDQQVVRMGANAGAGTIDLAELSSLSAGDVLVLDRTINDGLELTLNGTGQRDIDVRLHQEGGMLMLRIAPKHNRVVQ